MRPTYADDPQFLRLIRGEQPIELDRLALELARDASPGLPIDVHLGQIDRLADRTRSRLESTTNPMAVLRQINWTFSLEEGYRGNEEEYDDPRNSLLNEVIDRRLGIPISLGILYRAIAERLGITLEGVALPAHFVLRTVPPTPELFIDCFDGGAFLDRDGCRRLVARRTGQSLPIADDLFFPCSSLVLVRRMLMNLHSSYRRRDEPFLLVGVLERLHALDPGAVHVAIDLAERLHALDRPGRALEVTIEAIDQSPGEADAAPLQDLRSRLTQDLAHRN